VSLTPIVEPTAALLIEVAYALAEAAPKSTSAVASKLVIRCRIQLSPYSPNQLCLVLLVLVTSLSLFFPHLITRHPVGNEMDGIKT
jgi:hypothetical protein